ncbi:MAG: hypothetical protein F6K62_01785 [Sphaerospermopsis sp. SIO1G2]|nr:hypothetical protein [Sphaerospermopsis sp. SIO1G1]NET69809.1 hypothetical protein [Sphaerospermopsis sp. SIO1G2]
MKLRFLCIFLSTLILSFQIFISPAISQTLTQCQKHQEVFAFNIPNYPIQHIGGAILNIKVTYRMTPEAILENNYPDILSIQKDIDQFFIGYANESDYWEIMNKKLVKMLLDKYPQMSSLRVKIDVMPTVEEPLYRSSIVSSTRPESCDLRL